MALILYHQVADPVRVPHVDLQAPPMTLATTLTRVPAVIFVRIVAPVEGLVRRLAQQTASLMLVEASAVDGLETATSEKTINAAIAAVRRTAGEGRWRRRAEFSKIREPSCAAVVPLSGRLDEHGNGSFGPDGHGRVG